MPGSSWDPNVAPEAVVDAAGLWYPIMIAEENGELTESQAAAQLGVTVEQYGTEKTLAETAATDLLTEAPATISGLVSELIERPELFEQPGSQ